MVFGAGEGWGRGDIGLYQGWGLGAGQCEVLLGLGEGWGLLTRAGWEFDEELR